MNLTKGDDIMANVILGLFIAAYILTGISAMITLARKKMISAFCVYSGAFAVLLVLFPVLLCLSLQLFLESVQCSALQDL